MEDKTDRILTWMGTSINWQDFQVVSGTIARMEEEPPFEFFHGRLELENGYIFTFGFCGEGADWKWEPKEPPFEVTRTQAQEGREK